MKEIFYLHTPADQPPPGLHISKNISSAAFEYGGGGLSITHDGMFADNPVHGDFTTDGRTTQLCGDHPTAMR